jgi:thiamine pyrophosphokinase
LSEPRRSLRPPRPVKAIVVGNGRCPDRQSLPADALEGAELVVAADGGALCAETLQLRPDLVVGDGDSLQAAAVERLARSNIPFAMVSPDKDQSDLELAVRESVSRGAGEVVILAALHGDRIEHSVANLLLLALPELAQVDVRLVDERSTVRLLSASADGTASAAALHGRAGDFVSLFPWAGTAEGVTTEGLRFALRDAALPPGPSRGLSNEFIGDTATVGLRSGRLLIVQTTTRRSERPSDGAPTRPPQEAAE